MEKRNANSGVDPRDPVENGRAQVVFIAIGVAIIVGGLWLLYASTGPYHPDFPVSETDAQLYDGS